MIKIDNPQKFSVGNLCIYEFIKVHVIAHTRVSGLVQKRISLRIIREP